jgi:carbonic anhydrase/acetyltransferase-like protein (isoleucine patch superfamily)
MVIRTIAGLTPRIDTSAYIDQSAQVIGDVVIGEHSSVWPQVVIRGDIHKIRIGARSNIQDASILHVTHDSDYAPGGFALHIADDVTVGHAVILHGCHIGNQSLIGMGSIIMDGAIVEPGVMLAAGSLVSPGKTLESGYLWQGRPARRLRQLSDQEHQYLLYVAGHYVKLKNSYQSA